VTTQRAGRYKDPLPYPPIVVLNGIYGEEVTQLCLLFGMVPGFCYCLFITMSSLWVLPLTFSVAMQLASFGSHFLLRSPALTWLIQCLPSALAVVLMVLELAFSKMPIDKVAWDSAACFNALSLVSTPRTDLLSF
jgi:hypothetical protein